MPALGDASQYFNSLLLHQNLLNVRLNHELCSDCGCWKHSSFKVHYVQAVHGKYCIMCYMCSDFKKIMHRIKELRISIGIIAGNLPGHHWQFSLL